MKNLFKNLMLVAVAAMAFTACQNDNNEVNEVAKKTVLDFVATIANQDDTRSGFTGTYTEGEDTYYQSGWDGDETFIVCANGSFDANKTVAIEDAEGHFSVAFDGNVPSSIDVYSPASAWNSEFYPTIPAVQTPRANSVDPAAHILKAQAASVESGVVTLQHMVAYGKMTVNTPADFEISKVELSLVGLPYSSWTDNQTYSYTINANEVEGNVFWFATETMQIVKEFTVTAYNAEDQAYSKTVSMEGKEKPLAFNNGQVSTFSVSNLEAYVEPEEPKALVFTSAKWVNTSYSDKLVQFYTEDGGILQLNWYNCGSDAWIVPNTYGFASSGAIYYGGQYSWYENTTAGIDAEISNGTVVVSVVDGKYHIEFTNLADWDGNVYIESATFTGLISGLQVPDMRTALPKPTNVQVSVKGRVITTTWDAVEGADGYLFELYSPYDEKFTEIVEGTSFSFTGLNSLYYYYFKLSAYASDTNPNFRNSEEIYLEIKTEDTDPKMEVSESKLAFAADGGVKTFNVTLKNTDATIEYTKEGDWFTVEFSGDTFTVNASANESETEAREGSITVTAGELSQTITVTQSKKSSASTGGRDGKTLETAYKFTTYTKKTDSGYPVMCLSGSEDNAVFEFESNGQTSYPQGLVKFNEGPWYTSWIVYHVNGEIVHDTVGNTQKSSIKLSESYTYLTKSGNVYTVEYIKIVLDSGEEIWYTFDGTFTF